MELPPSPTSIYEPAGQLSSPGLYSWDWSLFILFVLVFEFEFFDAIDLNTSSLIYAKVVFHPEGVIMSQK
jgi:hypothetical protein